VSEQPGPNESGAPWWGQSWSDPGGAPASAPGAAAPQPTAALPTQPYPLPPSAQPPTSQTPQTPPKPPRQLPLLTGGILIVAIVALIAASAGAAIGVTVGRDDRTTTTVQPVAAATTGSGSAPTGQAETALEAVAHDVSPAVVLVTETTGDLLGTGSGIVLDAAKGYILTNNHVVSAFATGGGTLTVTTTSGQTVDATVVGRDPTADIAVIHVSLSGLTQARVGDSSTIAVGETVVAIGAPLGLQNTVTSGIVSALHRPVSTEDTTDATGGDTLATIDAIQTDAAINPGNSGGPLVDLSGDVVGVNSAIASVAQSSSSGQDQESGSIGVGFAIPIDEALYTADQLEKTGHAVHAVLGVSLKADETGTSTSGAVVASVMAGSPAAKAGFKAGDVITAIDGVRIPDADSAITAIRADHRPGDVVKVTLRRGGQTATLSVTLAASPPS
jgi:putative serine protease PepD